MADVNLFLFRTQAAKDEKAKGKGLGYLMRNEVQLDIKLVVDDDNLYKLVTEIKNLPEEVLQFPGLCSSPIKAGAAYGVSQKHFFKKKLGRYPHVPLWGLYKAYPKAFFRRTSLKGHTT